MLIRNAIIGVAISFLATPTMSQSYAVSCPANTESWDGGTKCRCVPGYIENQKRCVVFNLGTARVRALELRNIEVTDKSPEEKSDCRAMSRILNEFSRAVGFNSKQLATYAGQVLSQDGVVFRIGGVGVHSIVRPASSEYRVDNFEDRGFRPEYRQPSVKPPYNNQVRHFVGYFALGIEYSDGFLAEPTYTAILAELRDEGEQADIDLGNVAAALARQAAGSPHMMENLGVSIRTQVCN